MIRTFSRVVVCVALAALGAPINARAQTADPPPEGATDLEACEATLTKLLYSPKDDGTCLFSHRKVSWSRYALLLGRPGGQVLHGGAGLGEVLQLNNTSHATTGSSIVLTGDRVITRPRLLAEGYVTSPRIHATEAIVFPDGTTQTTAAIGGGSGTSGNTPGSLVQRDGAGGFAAGALTLSGKIDQTSDGGFVAQATGFLAFGGPIPASGPGRRLMWYPGKAAFRAGSVSDAQWDDANIGVHSTALGASSAGRIRHARRAPRRVSGSSPNAAAAGPSILHQIVLQLPRTPPA